MSDKSCPVPTPEERKYIEIKDAAERAMLDKVFAAINDAAAEVADRFREAGLAFEPTSADYFKFTVQQVMFVSLSGGDPNTMEGGDAEIGQRIVNNGQHIIDHYWRSAGEITNDG
ncbi:hypothetical protein [Rhizobium sp. BE258]|uniref:hypothetical protein n=1 Tax=Rhizobium sp. BE258 TaxID=2817722 RepID=UPI000DD68E6B|nr:hypothetical protein [Rhizobium sp. BE258]MDR7145103.1 hypothetical protein [Rhizobium sp. BE258]